MIRLLLSLPVHLEVSNFFLLLLFLPQRLDVYAVNVLTSLWTAIPLALDEAVCLLIAGLTVELCAPDRMTALWTWTPVPLALDDEHASSLLCPPSQSVSVADPSVVSCIFGSG